MPAHQCTGIDGTIVWEDVESGARHHVQQGQMNYDLLRHGVSDIVEYFLDLREGDFLWIVVDMHCLCRDGHLDGTYAL